MWEAMEIFCENEGLWSRMRKSGGIMEGPAVPNQQLLTERESLYILELILAIKILCTAPIISQSTLLLA